MSDSTHATPESADSDPGRSIIEALTRSTGVRPQVHLRDEASQPGSPLVKPVGQGHAIPERAGKYRLQGEIARGGVGVVYKGHDVDLGREVALKFLHERYQKDPTLLQRFIEEAQIGGQLQHPGIVPVYDLGLAGTRPYFTMKLVKGRTLAALLAERADARSDRPRLLAIFERVCETMAYAHARGVVHRDLKPANVMIGAFGEVQIVDWGMGKVLTQGGVADEQRCEKRRQTEVSIIATVRSGGQGTQSIVGSAMGTPAYMPPEQATGDVEHMDERSDVFSLGAMLCEILTGKGPYVGEAADVLRMAACCELDGARARLAASEADPELVQLTLDCLSPSPSARPASAKEIAERIGRHLTANQEKVQEAQVRARAAHRTQKLTLLFGAVIAAALLVSLTFWRRAETERQHAQTAAGIAETARAQAASDAEQARLAQQQEQAARADADAKAVALTKALDDFDLLANVVKLREASATEKQLYPAWPQQAGALRSWLDDQARPLAAALPGIEATLARLRQRGRRNGEAYVFAAKSDQFLHDTLARLVTDLQAFVDPAHGPMAAAEERLDWATHVAQQTIEAYRREWHEAAAAIAASPRYGGLHLSPQIGLVPICADPKSGLWEFVHLRSGTPGKAIPQRDPVTGRFVVTEDSGIVFVLVPGGTFTMGAQSTDPDGQNFDPQAEEKEGPPHAVELAPYFLSKYELTQAQWRRLSRGEEPSGYRAGTKPGKIDITWVNPVENISWSDASELLRRLGLMLPTEAQWEYACRGGTSTPWSTGSTAASLQGFANVADQAAKRKGVSWQIEETIDDGQVLHAHVGSFAPNPFGFCDMHGNVWEWCRDGNAGYDVAPRAGDGLREAKDDSVRINRGGSFAFPASRARSAYRFFDSPDTRDFNLGVRPMRPLQDDATR